MCPLRPEELLSSNQVVDSIYENRDREKFYYLVPQECD